MIIPHSQPWITREDRLSIDRILASGQICDGAITRDFEQEVTSYLGLAGGVATSNGTCALFLALKALSITEGDEVIIPTYVCEAVWRAVVWTGATPVLCDVGDDWCMNASTIKACIRNNTKAIVVVHIFGIKAEVEAIKAFGIPIVEDCCQAFGAKDQYGLAGTCGEYCICSFHATKLLTTGEGGMVLARTENGFQKLKDLRFDQDESLAAKYVFPMTDFQAALGLNQLARYATFLKRRIDFSDYYFENIDSSKVDLPFNVRERSVFFRYPLRIKGDFKVFQEYFSRFGIQVRRGVDTLLHRRLNLNADLFKGAEKCFQETLSIPIYPKLTQGECEYISDNASMIFKNDD